MIDNHNDSHDQTPMTVGDIVANVKSVGAAVIISEHGATAIPRTDTVQPITDALQAARLAINNHYQLGFDNDQVSYLSEAVSQLVEVVELMNRSESEAVAALVEGEEE